MHGVKKRKKQKTDCRKKVVNGMKNERERKGGKKERVRLYIVMIEWKDR